MLKRFDPKSAAFSRRKFLLTSAAVGAGSVLGSFGQNAEAFLNAGAFWKKSSAGSGQTSNGYTIGQSLRFNGSDAHLTRTPAASGTNKYTFSAWVKRGNIAASQEILFSVRNGSNYERIGFVSDHTLFMDVNTTTSATNTIVTAAVFRDPSAWYHIVAVWDGANATASERMKIYVNGTRVTSFASANYPGSGVQCLANQAYTHYLGTKGDSTQFFSGYMAEVYLIDGNAYDASYFGQLDTNTGQWIPKAYAGSYGANGFYLKFSSNTAVNGAGTSAGGTLAGLGADFSGNNNHWSGGASLISSSAGTALGTMVQNGGVAAAFDGVIGTPYAVDGQANNPKTIGKDWGAGVTRVVTKFTWYGMSNGTTLAGAAIKLQGSTDNFSSSIVDLYSGTLAGTDTETFTANASVTSTAYRYHRIAIYTNAQVDTAEVQFFEVPVQTHDQVLDSPTNNFAHLNPLVKGGVVTFGEGNLYATVPNTVVGNGYPNRASLGISSGKWYWEVQPLGTAGGGVFVGLCNENYSASTGYPSDGTNGWDAYFNSTTVFRTRYNSTTVDRTRTIAFNEDLILVAVDLSDSANKKLWFGHYDISTSSMVWFDNSGGTTGNPATGANATYTISGSDFFPVLDIYQSTNAYSGRVNFGQGGQAGLTYDAASGGKFKYTPPAGFKALSTANLPVPVIKKPNQYFDVLTYTGNGTARSFTGLLAPDFVWIKDRATSGGHSLYDKARGAAKLLSSHNTAAEQTSYTDTLTSFNADGFSLGADSTGNWVNMSGRTYVSWCWKKGATPGFDVVTKTTVAGDTVSHSLNAVPAMVIARHRGDVHSWRVWHQAMNPATDANMKYMWLQTTSAAAGPNQAIFKGPFTSNSIGVGTDPDMVGDMLFYLWAEVSGFSKFGSYTGNGSADGPFVYCGFKPRFVMVKRSDSTGHWCMIDSARSYNGQTGSIFLFANVTNAELGNEPIDFLSNGFKLKYAGSGDTNTSGGTYIFAAFAEAPFKYSTAR